MSFVSSNGVFPLRDGIGALQPAKFRLLVVAERNQQPIHNEWPDLATHDPTVHATWVEHYPSYNLGIVLGLQPQLGHVTYFVIDLDVDDSGKDGAESLFEYMVAHQTGPLPQTLQQITGGGGRHVFLQCSGDLHIPNRVGVLPGVDVRGDRGFVVAPPSLHPSGSFYQWQEPVQPIAEAPQWLLDLVGAHNRGERSRRNDKIDTATEGSPLLEGERNDELFRIACSLRNRGMSRNGILGHLHDVNASRCQPPLGLDDLETIADSATKYDPGVELPHWPPPSSNGTSEQSSSGWVTIHEELQSTDARNSDRYNGIEFAQLYGDYVIYTAEAGWFCWDGKRWSSDDLLLHEKLMGQMTHVLRRRYVNATATEQELIHARIKRLESASGHNSALRFAEIELVRKITELDQNPWLVNFQNCTFNLQTFETRVHDPSDYLTGMCTVEYDPEAVDPVWEAFLEVALPDPEMRLTFQAFMGSCLTGVCKDKAILIPMGPTDTGKSTAVEPCSSVLGQVESGGYAASWPSEVVERGRQINVEEKKHQVRRARLVIVAELTKGSRFNDGFVKQFTGGDVVSARGLYKGSYSYRPQAKLVMHTNFVPRSADKATQNRLKLLPFRNQFVNKDEGIKQYLESHPDAQRAVATWMVLGAMLWQQQGLGKMPWLNPYLNQYNLDSNPVAAFREESLTDGVSDPNQWATVDSVWTAYRAYEAENAVRPRGRRSFNSAMEELGLERTRVGHGPWRWQGVQLRGPYTVSSPGV